MLQEKYTSDELKEILKEAHYHLGRVLYEGELDYDRAVSELEQAVRDDPENTAALYHLGQAIRAQVERNKLRRAEEVLREYLVKGAPIGHEDEVREFLGSRRVLR
jgi:tetratricopeptide (TPR) repeat protein